MRQLITLLFIWLTSLNVHSQGLLVHSANVQDGLVLFTHQNKTFLIDECSEIVNEWDIGFPNFHVKLLENGNVIYIRSNSIFEKNWEDEIVHEISLNDPLIKLTYETVKLENGNFLAVGRRSTNSTIISEIGWTYFAKPNQYDVVVEVDANGDIVWEWRIIDHLIQDQIDSVSTFGIINENPQLMDLNSISNHDWVGAEMFMINSMSYNSELDQVILSIRKSSEIIIIDHSTTTEEATSHTGGRSGKGGDILFRWGNTNNYSNQNNRNLFFQHNPHWIANGDNSGDILVFNNGLTDAEGSTVEIISPTVLEDGNYLMEDSLFLPINSKKSIHNSVFGSLSSDYTSGASIMENGNTYITLGGAETLIEIDQNENIVWQYNIPGSSYIYRSEKYPRSYPGFEGKDLTGKSSYISDIEPSVPCSILNSHEDLETSNIEIKDQDFEITIINGEKKNITIELYTSNGILAFNNESNLREIQLSKAEFAKGIYFLTVRSDDQKMITKKIFMH